MIGVIGARYTGRFIVTELLRADESVAVLARDPDRTRAGLDVDVPVHELDLERPFPDLPELDCVVSTAPIQMAAHVVRLCEHLGVDRALFLSSVWRHSRSRRSEVEAVIEGETSVTESDLNWTILRPTMIYGPGDRNVSRLRRRIAQHRVLPIIGAGMRLVQPVYVQDVAVAVSAALSRASSVRRSFDLCGPEPMTYTRMVDTIASSLNRSPIKVYVPVSIALRVAWVLERTSQQPALTRDRVLRMAEDHHFDIGDASEALGFFPRTFEEGLGEMGMS